MSVLEIPCSFRSLTPIIPSGVDPLERFEEYRKKECMDFHFAKDRPAEVVLPPASMAPADRLLAYAVNGESAVNQSRGGSTFTDWGWDTRGFIGFWPYMEGAVSTGIHWKGAAILHVSDDQSLGVKIVWDVMEKYGSTQTDHMHRVKSFFEA